MAESDIAPDPEVQFSELYDKYKDPTITKEKKNQIRDQLLNMVPHLPYPEMAVDLATEFGPEAVYSRLNQLHKDQLARHGYSELGGLVSLYERLEAISELNKGTNPKQGDGQVTLFSGQFVHSDIDLRIKGRGFDFEFERTYKSQVVYAGPLGANWDHSYNLWLRVEDGGSRVVRSTGRMREDTYVWDVEENAYTIPNGFFAKLTEEVILLPGIGNLGSRYVLETIDGTRYIYKEIPYSNGLYKVEYIVDRFGNRMSFKYDNNNKGRLETITDTLGKKIEFFYDDRDRIIEIRDKDRSVFYYYDDNNDLICVKKPEPEPGKEAPVTQYEYSSYDKPKEFLHNLVAIIDPEGNRYLENEYGATKGLLSFNRVVRQRNGQGEFLYEYRELYSESSGEEEIDRPRHKTIVTKRNNQIGEYIFNSQGNLLKMTECIRGVGKLVVPVSIEYHYNKDGNMIWMKDPVGNITHYVYHRDWYGLNGGTTPTLEERRKFGNLLKIVKQSKGSNTNLSTSSPFIDPEDIVFEVEYDNLYNQVTLRKDPRNKNWKTEFVYSLSPDGPITKDTDGIFLRRIVNPEVTLPDGKKHKLKRDFEYNQYGQIKVEITSRQTFVQNGNIVISNQQIEIVTKYYYFGEPVTDEPTVAGDASKTGYLHLVKLDAGQDTKSRHFLNIKTIFDVDRVGNIVAITDGRGNTTTYNYDKLDRQKEIILPLHGISEKTVYDRNSRVVRIEEDLKDALGNPYQPDSELITEREYDCMDNLIKEKVGVESSLEELITYYAYTPSDRLCKTTDPKGNVIRYRHNERDFVKSETKGFVTPDESTTKYSYDYAGHVVRIKNGKGYATEIKYDEFSRIKSQTDALGNKDTYEYDKLGNVTKRCFTDRNGVLLTQTEYDYDEVGRLKERNDFWFKTGEEANAIPVRTHFYFDEEDSLVRVVTDADDLGQNTDFEYDALDRQIKLIDNLGNETINEYDANNNLIKTIEVEKRSDGSGQEVFVTQNGYDELNRLIKTIDNLGNTTHYLYNSQDNLEKIEDALGNIVRHEYDIFGRKILEIREKKEGVEVKIKYTYDKNDLLIKIQDDKGNPTIFRYDSLDRQVETEYADGSIEKTIYDKNSNVVQETDCNGLVKKNIYDELDRLKRVDIDKSNLAAGIMILGPVFATFDYDELGRMVKVTNESGIVEFGFDSLGNLLSEVQNGRIVKSEYNTLGFRKALTYPSGRKINFLPDGLNRTQRIGNIALGNDYQGEAGVGAILLNDSFVGPSRLVERQFGNGAKASFCYDGVRRTISIKYSKNGTLLFEIQSLYDAVGNKMFENTLKGLNKSGEFYSYDSLYRLIEARQGLAIPSFNATDFQPANPKMGISPDKPLTQVQIDDFINAIVLPNGNRTAFDYDSLGNRLTRKETGNPTVAYQTNNLNEYTSINGVTPSYDKNGNMTSDGTFKYFYDYKNRLSKVEDANGNPIAGYGYDALGRRIEKMANGGKTIFIYDGDNVIEERDDQGKIVAHYVFGDDVDEIIQMVREKKDHYYLRNSLENVIALSGNVKNIVEEYSYSPFGIVKSVSSVGNPYLFTSRRLDPETKLMYYRARHYSSELGRLLQRDPIGYDDSMNLFEYVGNNPINQIDPTGLQQEPKREPSVHIDFGKDPGEGFVYDPKTGVWADPVYRSSKETVPMIAGTMKTVSREILRALMDWFGQKPEPSGTKYEKTGAKPPAIERKIEPEKEPPKPHRKSRGERIRQTPPKESGPRSNVLYKNKLPYKKPWTRYRCGPGGAGGNLGTAILLGMEIFIDKLIEKIRADPRVPKTNDTPFWARRAEQRREFAVQVHAQKVWSAYKGLMGDYPKHWWSTKVIREETERILKSQSRYKELEIYKNWVWRVEPVKSTDPLPFLK